jgi:ABC-type sugar transport system ATPase subunit
VSVIYSARGISKRFGAVHALSDVDFDVIEGKVNGLVGANGAGKSTLLKIIAGALPPDAGELKLDGRPLAMHAITDAARAGIAMVSQELSLFPALSVEENLLLAPGGGAWQARRAFGRRANAVLEQLGVHVSLRSALHRLSLADRQLVEIARAVLQNPRVLILDEPTSSLHVAEVERLHEIIRGLRDSGIGIVYVSHFLEELLEISDNLVILRNGKRVPGDITPAADQLKTVVAAMLGETPESMAERAQRSGDRGEADGSIPEIKVDPLRIVGLRGPSDLVIENLEIKPGAIVGVAGLAGAGVEELFAVLFGVAKPKAGQVTLPSGVPLPTSTAGAVKAGIAYTPADRKQYGLMLRQSVAENVVGVRAPALSCAPNVCDERRSNAAASLASSPARCSSRSARYRAAISRKSCSPNGSRRRLRCWYSTIRPVASTSAPNGKCTASCAAWPSRGVWCCSIRAIPARSWRCRTGSSFSSMAC